MPDLKNPNELDNVAPAQMVGGMRVKQADHRVPLKEQEDSMKDNQESNELTQQSETQDDRARELQERQARDMYAHQAAKQPFATKNPGTNVEQNFIPPVQPRSLNN